MDNQFNKALRLLDMGQTEKALTILDDILTISQEENNKLFFIRVSCVLGELYFSAEKYREAKEHLSNVVNTVYENDVVGYEKTLAQALLDNIA